MLVIVELFSRMLIFSLKKIWRVKKIIISRNAVVNEKNIA